MLKTTTAITLGRKQVHDLPYMPDICRIDAGLRANVAEAFHQSLLRSSVKNYYKARAYLCSSWMAEEGVSEALRIEI